MNKIAKHILLNIKSFPIDDSSRIILEVELNLETPAQGLCSTL